MVDMDGSFLQLPLLETVSTVPLELQNNDQPLVDKSDAILAYLQRINQANQALVKRVNDLESHRSTSSTPLGSQPHLPAGHVHGQQTQSNQLHSLGSRRTDPIKVPMATHIPSGLASGLGSQGTHLHTAVGQPVINHQHSQFNSDGILPSISGLRQNTSVSQMVAKVMATYENQAKQEAAIGKNNPVKKSGRFNTTDTITSVPELRWSNEGYHGMTIFHFLSGQWANFFNNIFQIKNPVTVKRALLQTITALKDAASLPWPAVWAAYANSMHDIEQGILSWEDHTQWSLNKLSASQIVMANANTVANQGSFKKIYKYFNEGTCSFENNRANFRHVCAFCAKSGKNLVHPESKCLTKQRGQERNHNK